MEKEELKSKLLFLSEFESIRVPFKPSKVKSMIKDFDLDHKFNIVKSVFNESIVMRLPINSIIEEVTRFLKSEVSEIGLDIFQSVKTEGDSHYIRSVVSNVSKKIGCVSKVSVSGKNIEITEVISNRKSFTKNEYEAIRRCFDSELERIRSLTVGMDSSVNCKAPGWESITFENGIFKDNEGFEINVDSYTKAERDYFINGEETI